jgi:glycosyltransferase involved in cell wall biosynthesis
MDKIRSLHIIGSKAFGGAERWFQRFTRALAERGNPTELAVRKGHDLDADLWGGLPCHPLPMRTVWDPLSRREVSRTIRGVAPDLVQTYMGRATRLTRIPRDSGAVHVARLGGYYKLGGYRHAHAWVCNTKGLCDHLVRDGFPADRVFHIYNFLDLPVSGNDGEGVALRTSLGIPPDAWVLLTPGRFVPVKGHRFLLEALAGLPAEIAGRPLQLVMLGDGVLGDNLKAQAEQAGIADRIIWAGWQNDPAPYYRMADMVVFPSLEQETFGNVVLEAWAFGKPLVTTAFRGAVEYVRDGEDARRVPCEDSMALAAAIRELLADYPSARRMAEAGHRRLQQDFSQDER